MIGLQRSHRGGRHPRTGLNLAGRIESVKKMTMDDDEMMSSACRLYLVESSQPGQ